MPSAMSRRSPVKSAVETLNPTRVKLTVEVTYDELKPSLDAAYKKIGAHSKADATAFAFNNGLL